MRTSWVKNESAHAEEYADVLQQARLGGAFVSDILPLRLLKPIKILEHLPDRRQVSAECLRNIGPESAENRMVMSSIVIVEVVDCLCMSILLVNLFFWVQSNLHNRFLPMLFRAYKFLVRF